MANEVIHNILTTWDFCTESSIYILGYTEVGHNSDVGSSSKAAFRYASINIPQGYNLNSAELRIRAQYKNGSGRLRIRCYGADVDDITDFYSSNPFGNTHTSAYVDKDIGISEVGDYLEFNVTSIIKEIIDRGGWSQGHLAFLIENNGSDTGCRVTTGQIEGFFTYLAYRLDAEPNFKPTPKSVTAPVIPDPKKFVMKFAKKGKNVFKASDEDLIYTSDKLQFKILSEGQIDSLTSPVTIPHDLGYIPFVSVSERDSLTGEWYQIPRTNYFSFDYGFYVVDDVALYVFPGGVADAFYYHIYLEQLA